MQKTDEEVTLEKRLADLDRERKAIIDKLMDIQAGKMPDLEVSWHQPRRKPYLVK